MLRGRRHQLKADLLGLSKGAEHLHIDLPQGLGVRALEGVVSLPVAVGMFGVIVAVVIVSALAVLLIMLMMFRSACSNIDSLQRAGSLGWQYEKMIGRFQLFLCLLQGCLFLIGSRRVLEAHEVMAWSLQGNLQRACVQYCIEA